MAINISVVLLLLLVAVIFMRGGAPLKLSHALVCMLLGFLLSGTSIAPAVHDGVSATADLINGIRP